MESQRRGDGKESELRRKDGTKPKLRRTKRRDRMES